jgi:hypothetical protein
MNVNYICTFSYLKILQDEVIFRLYFQLGTSVKGPSVGIQKHSQWISYPYAAIIDGQVYTVIPCQVCSISQLNNL